MDQTPFWTLSFLESQGAENHQLKPQVFDQSSATDSQSSLSPLPIVALSLCTAHRQLCPCGFVEDLDFT